MLSKTHEFNHWRLCNSPALSRSFVSLCLLAVIICALYWVILLYLVVATAVDQISTAMAAQHELEDILNGRSILVDQSKGYAEARITWVGTCVDGRPVVGRLSDYQDIREN